ncbi:hypothetical protein MCNS_29570 [Mycobacterium conspicuum]|uniref:Uncharacterized protein n=1 Tax=Mycobacterium conspicuum TaxID=44010 RepID=A0A7I7YF54_9MYCO|nr:hypothetical protein MCNS_29570 [Mycobacterium conspicuum]
MELRPHLFGRQLHTDLQRVEELRNVVMGHRNAFGDAGAAGGVDDVGEVVRGRRRRRGAGLAVDCGIADIDDRQAQPVQPRRQVGGGERRGRGRIGGHEFDPARRQRRVDGQVGRPGFQHRQNRDDRVGGARKQQRHTPPRARAPRGQQVRHPIGGLIEFAVGQRNRPAADRRRIRGAGHLRGKQRRQRRRRCGLGQHGSVADRVKLGTFIGVQQIQ